MTMPAAFLGHGSPMNAIERNRYTEAWHRFGRACGVPRGAHTRRTRKSSFVFRGASMGAMTSTNPAGASQTSPVDQSRITKSSESNPSMNPKPMV